MKKKFNSVVIAGFSLIIISLILAGLTVSSFGLPFSVVSSCSEVFRTNANGDYVSGTWIALDVNGDEILEGFDYSGKTSKSSTRGVDCTGSGDYTLLGIQTPEGHDVVLFQNRITAPAVCEVNSPESVTFRFYYDSSSVADTTCDIQVCQEGETQCIGNKNSICTNNQYITSEVQVGVCGVECVVDSDCAEFNTCNSNVCEVDANAELIALLESQTSTIEEQTQLISQLEGTITEKEELINSLSLDSETKAQLILSLEETITSQEQQIDTLTNQINSNQLTIQEQINQINSLNLNLEEKADLINSLEISLQDKANLINSLESELDDKAVIISNLEISLDEKTALIDSLNLDIQDQATLISDLEATVSEKETIITDLSDTIEERDAQLDALKQREQFKQLGVSGVIFLIGVGLVVVGRRK